MYACRFADGHVALLGTTPPEAIQTFEFELSDLPTPPTDEPYDLRVDFTNQTFALVKVEVEPTPAPSGSPDYDAFLEGLMEGYSHG